MPKISELQFATQTDNDDFILLVKNDNGVFSSKKIRLQEFFSNLQSKLIDGQSIKSINGISLLGDGNITISTANNNPINIAEVLGLDTALQGLNSLIQLKENDLGDASAAYILNGNREWVLLNDSILNALLNNLDIPSATGEIASTDSIAHALAKLQKQINNLASVSTNDTAILNQVLSGLNITELGTVSANDNILTAMGKLQRQINSITAGTRPQYGNVVDIGGEGYYPYDVSEGTLYTQDTVITLPAGVYRIITVDAPSGNGANPVSGDNQTSVVDHITGQYYCGVGINAYATIPPQRSAKNNGDSYKGWSPTNLVGTETTESLNALKYVFSQAPELSKGPDVLVSSSTNYSYSGNLSVSNVLNFLEPKQIQINVSSVSFSASSFQVPQSSKNFYGFVWIREVSTESAQPV